jgi:hypothetical protein
MVVAVVSLAALLLTVTVATRWTRRHRTAPAAYLGQPAAYLGQNVVSLDVYRLARLSGRGSDPAARPRFDYPLSATSGGGLRTVRQPDGRFARPTARPELA